MDNSNSLRQYFPDIQLQQNDKKLTILEVFNCTNLSYAEVMSKIRFGNQSEDGPTIKIFERNVSLSALQIANMQNVQILKLINNNIQFFTARYFSFLPNLIYLHLKDGCIHLESGAFSGLHKLKNVLLEGNIAFPANDYDDSNQFHCQSNSYPENLFNENKMLQSVRIENSIHLKTLPENLFSNLTKLVDLDMNGNGLEHLPSDLFLNCTNLSRIELSDNTKLKKLPENIFSDLPSLIALQLNGNGLEQLPSQLFRNCVSLAAIQISNNFQLKSLPENLFSDLPSLSTLQLNGNGLEHLPSDLFLNCTNLSEIELTDNTKLKKLPENIFSVLPSLITLQLNGNGLEQLPSYIFRNCTYLAIIDISNNIHLKILPEILFSNLTQLVELYLNGNGLEQLPANLFRNCTRLSKIAISNNYLKSLPEEIFTKLTGLTTLVLGKNLITDLPRNLFQHQTLLVSLDLSYNKLHNIEPALEILWKHNNLLELLLNNNQMDIPLNLMKSIQENGGSMQRLFIEGNTLKCDCHNLLEYRFDRKMVDIDKVLCKDDPAAAGRTYKDALTDIESICDKSKLYISIGVAACIPILLLVTAIALYYKYQTNVKVFLYARGCCLRWITEEELDKDKLYDVFISFSHKDESFVQNELVTKLEGPPYQHKVCVHYRDWMAGEIISEQIAQSIHKSKRTIIVLSPDFLESKWSKFEFRVAHYNSLKERRIRLIPLMYKDVGDLEEIDRELNAYLQTNTYVKWGDPWFWEKLNYALPHSSNHNAPGRSEDIEMIEV